MNINNVKERYFKLLEGYMTVSEMAEKWRLKPRTIQMMCLSGRIEGAGSEVSRE